MLGRIIVFLKYILFWIILFAFQKWFFMITQYSLLGEGVSWLDWWRVLVHGFTLDLATSSYITVGIGIFLSISYFVDRRLIQKMINYYTIIILFVALLIIIADVFTFPSWRFHIDKIIFFYLDDIKDVWACAQWYVWLGGLFGLMVLLSIVYSLFTLYMRWDKCLVTYFPSCERHCMWKSLLMFLLTGCLFLPIRGGVTVSTTNTGQVYFSDNHMLNIMAVNPIFNMFESLSSPQFDISKYTYMSSHEAKKHIDELLPQKAYKAPTNSPFCISKFNIVFFIVESLSANAMTFMGEDEKITPNLNQLTHEGIFFSNAYASSFRTDRGVVSLLSCFPGQPTYSLMLVSKKCNNLPYWTRDFANAGYRLKFYYGGDENFAHMRSYLINAGFTDRICDTDFPISLRLSKWGVHDEIVLNKVFEDIISDNDTSPFLRVILTLSSHEPFEVPTHRSEHPYLNSLAYTDSCIGDFITKLKETSRWDSTLVVIVSDHGFAYPDTLTNYDLAKYHIPILFLGGVVDEPQIIDKVVSQIDIGYTLSSILDSHSNFEFAKNLFDMSVPSFAFFSFNDGFALVTDSTATVFDAKLKDVVYETSKSDELHRRQACAIMQCVYETIDNL